VTRSASNGVFVGRASELALLDAQLARVKERGGALVIRGDAGVGKSALLDAARRHAAARGLATLTTSGVQSEAHLAFAGLHQLLRSALPVAVDKLPAPQRRAIKAAFGLIDGPIPDFFLIALATLELLSELAAQAPLLLVVEDAHWLDAATSDVLAFVARRLETEPIVAFFEVRDGIAARLDFAALPELRLEPLDETASGAVLDAVAPGLGPDVRSRVLAEALGNPLALVELPQALAAGFDPSSERPLPLTQRLESAFAARVAGLPTVTRTLLLVAALDDYGDVRRLLSAACILEGEAVSASDLSAAIDARIVLDEDNRVGFRHPLVRSAIYQGAQGRERRAAHAALAEAYRDDPDRAVWHRAASLDLPDDRVAAQLESAAERALRRGASATAAAALERAARLTTGDERRGRFLIWAASIEFELGRLDVSARFARRAGRLALAPEDRAVLPFLRELFEQGAWSGAARIGAVVDTAQRLAAGGEAERALDTLQIVSSRCWWGNPAEEIRDRVVAAATSLPFPRDSPRLLFLLAHADPVRHGAVVTERISRLAPDLADPSVAFLLGAAASAAWSFDLALPFLETAIGGLRAQGRIGLLAEALVAQAWAAVHRAREPLAVAAAEEAIALSLETGQRRWAVAASLAKATIAAERGDFDGMDTLAREAERAILGIGASPLLALVQFARGRGAVAHQRYEEGLEHLRRSLDPADPAYHPFIGAWGLSDLVEAAAHTGRMDAARAYLEQLESLAAATSGSLLRAEAGYARPMIAGDEAAEGLYRAAIERDLATWPCYRGRMLLWYGRWLRRQRRVAESRAPLRLAREGFDALAFPVLAETARQELRASGERSRRRAPETWDRLSPQELQIARLAAEGLTNREIGRKLYLSHRTVESHLYRIFPKLGVTTRMQLRGAIPESAPA
jgi:DNA-binding CsgD family transcriptional regulator